MRKDRNHWWDRAESSRGDDFDHESGDGNRERLSPVIEAPAAQPTAPPATLVACQPEPPSKAPRLAVATPVIPRRTLRLPSLRPAGWRGRSGLADCPPARSGFHRFVGLSRCATSVSSTTNTISSPGLGGHAKGKTSISHSSRQGRPHTVAAQGERKTALLRQCVLQQRQPALPQRSPRTSAGVTCGFPGRSRSEVLTGPALHGQHPALQRAEGRARPANPRSEAPPGGALTWEQRQMQSR